MYDRRVAQVAASLRPLVANDAHEETAIALSPDGCWLAYASNELGRFEIYVRPFPDIDAGRWQISRTGGHEPRWARSGRELFYRSAEGILMAVPVEASDSFVAGSPGALFRASGFLPNSAYTGYDVAPDGRFLFLRYLARSSDVPLANTAVLVRHWVAGLAARGVGGD